MTPHPSTFAALAVLDTDLARGQAAAGIVRKPAPPVADCRICGGSGEDAYGQRCVCTYNKDRAPKVDHWAFNALVKDIAEIREGSASLNHDRFCDQ